MSRPDDRGRSPLLIWRRPGRGLYVGRQVKVTVVECTAYAVRLAVEAPLVVVVSPPTVSTEEHLALQMDRDAGAPVAGRDVTSVLLHLQESVRIGREATLTYVGEQGSQRASLSVNAPLNVAVTRDDFTFEEHLAIQARRERGGRG